MSNKPLSIDRALTKAESLAKKGELAQAIQFYRAVLKKFPGNERAIEGLQSLNRSNRGHEKIDLDTGPTPDEVDDLIALYRKKQLQAALERGTILAKRHPNVPLFPNILGAVNAGLGRLDQAVESYTRALQIKPDYAEAHSNLGNALKALGRHEGAVASYSKALQIKPDYAEAHSNLGIALKALGRPEEAVASFTKALQIRPDYAEAHSNLGNALKALGRHEGAVASYTKALQIKPDYAEAHNNLGNVLIDLGKPEEAIASYTRALQIKPDYGEVSSNLGNVLKDLGRHEEAIECFTRALSIKPDYAEAHYNLGIVLKALARHEEAIASYTRALRIKPDYAEAHSNLGNALIDLGKPEEAVASYSRTLQIRPDYAEAHNNLGIALKTLARHEEAIASFTRALRIKPDYAEAHSNLGIALKAIGNREEAVACFSAALQIKPDFAEAHNNLGNVLIDLGEYEKAIASFTAALQIKPNYAEAKSHKIHQQAHICDWASLENEGSALPSSLAGLGTTGTAVPPFSILSFEDHPERHLKRSEFHAKKEYIRAALPEIQHPHVKPDRIRIGYFSADFHNHATMYLMAKLFELHDKDQFSIHAYSYGPDKNDGMRSRLKDAVNVFHDVRGLGDKEAAQLARNESIDIAIDLKGYTTNTRTGIFSYRAAPVQVNYLGYPGTLGAPFIDYIVADKTLIPKSSRKFYSENVIYLPHSYQVNDNTRKIADRTPSREEVGLPETGFVFCCFNNTYKISPKEFDIWMRLLHKVEGSVLWLLKANQWAKENLAHEAHKRGIDPDRLIFAERMPLPEHLARHRIADLFLDTFNYNAHTTASDALWAGLPVLTKIGDGFAARVGASLLNAIDLSELITPTEEAYENLALDLATNPENLKGLKEKLLANRDTKPLFDTELFTRHLETAYREIYDLYYEGAEPKHIIISVERRYSPDSAAF